MSTLQKDLQVTNRSIPLVTDVLLDMDGVLVDDVAMFSRLQPAIQDMEAYLKFLSIIGKRQEFIFPLIELAIQTKHFANAPATNFLATVIQILLPYWESKGIKVAILTSTMAVNPNRKELESQKLKWLQDNGLGHLPVIFAEGSAKKQEYATPTTLLIDDFDRTIGQFRSKGGMAIQYTKLTEVLEQLSLLELYEVFTDF